MSRWRFLLREDIEPNIDYELQRFATNKKNQIRFDKEARTLYTTFASSTQAAWRGNFRELSASITRMATLAEQGRISTILVEEEIERLRTNWQSQPPLTTFSALPANIDLFDKRQLETVIEVCRSAASLSEAGRRLFAVSREQKKQPNDADRLRKYLARFGLSWDELKNG